MIGRMLRSTGRVVLVVMAMSALATGIAIGAEDNVSKTRTIQSTLSLALASEHNHDILGLLLAARKLGDLKAHVTWQDASKETATRTLDRGELLRMARQLSGGDDTLSATINAEAARPAAAASFSCACTYLASCESEANACSARPQCECSGK